MYETLHGLLFEVPSFIKLHLNIFFIKCTFQINYPFLFIFQSVSWANFLLGILIQAMLYVLVRSIDAVGSSLSACYVTWFFRWATGSCSLDSLYDLDLISSKIRVILDNSKAWSHILSTSSKLGRKGVVHVNGVSRSDLNENNHYSNVLLINRTASPLAW